MQRRLLPSHPPPRPWPFRTGSQTIVSRFRLTPFQVRSHVIIFHPHPPGADVPCGKRHFFAALPLPFFFARALRLSASMCALQMVLHADWKYICSLAWTDVLIFRLPSWRRDAGAASVRRARGGWCWCACACACVVGAVGGGKNPNEHGWRHTAKLCWRKRYFRTGDDVPLLSRGRRSPRHPCPRRPCLPCACLPACSRGCCASSSVSLICRHPCSSRTGA